MTLPAHPAEHDAPSISRHLATFASELTAAKLPASVREKATHHIADAIGLAFASHQFGFAAPILGGIAAAGAPGDVTVIGSPLRLAPRDAALANGVLIHGLDFDDTHPLAIVHPSAACLPAALAMAQSLDATWDEFLCAYAAGMEVAIRLGVAVKGGFHHAGFHATGLIAHFSAAIIAGKLLGLDPSRLIAAQGIVASTASGVQVFLEEGAWTKRMHPGWGALAGITAAHLAEAGFAGPTRAYEGRFGFFETHLQNGAQADLRAIVDGLGDAWLMEGTAIKPYPVCHFLHGCAEAAIVLHDTFSQPGSLEQIDTIECRLPAPTLPIVAEPAHAKQAPRTDYEAKFSAPFVVAACLARGHFGLAELDEASLADSTIARLAGKVHCVADPAADFPRYFSGSVALRLRDGTERAHAIDINLGCAERALDVRAIAEKFRGTAGLTLTPERVDTLLDALLHGSGSTRIRDLAVLLGPSVNDG